MPSNPKIIQENLALNPSLASKISVVPKTLWSRSEETFVFEDNGAGSHRSSDGRGVNVETHSIDDLVSANSLRRVDFIKMDIEGSEPDALNGGERTIRRDRPQLAIPLYHDLSHFASIPNWIAGLNLWYRFYLDHFTIHHEETILLARSDFHS
jgi:FkbM family methyltransferase